MSSIAESYTRLPSRSVDVEISPKYLNLISSHPNMKRREFLSESAVAVASFSFPSEILGILNYFGFQIRTNDPTRNRILAVAEADRLKSNTSQSTHILALPSIYRISGHNPSASEIQRALDNAGKFDRSTLAASTDFFKIENPEQYAHAFGIAAQTIAVVGTTLFPGAGLALGMVGVMAEDVWKAVSHGRDLSANPFVSTDPEEKNRVNRYILESAANQSAANSHFESGLLSPKVRTATGVDFGASLDNLLAHLPEKLRGVVTQALETSNKDLRGNLQLQQTELKKLTDKFNGQLEEYDAQLKTFSGLLEQQHKEAERELIRNRIAGLQNEVAAGISILTLVVGRATGDQRMAQEMGKALSAIANIGFAVASHNYLGAIAIGLSLFNSSDRHPTGLVLDLLEKFGQRLEHLRAEMHERFDRLELQQQEMLKQLGRIYSTIREDFAVVSQRISLVQSNFDEYRKLVDADNRNQATSLVEQTFSQALSVRGGKKAGWQSLYLNTLPIFVNHARRESRNSYFRGRNNISVAGDLAKEVRLRNSAEQLVGIMTYACRMANVPVQSDLCNPFALELGAEAFMQADLLLENIPNVERTRQLKSMWDDATALRSALINFGSTKVISSLTDLYENEFLIPDDEQTQNLMSTFRSFQQKWAKEQLKPFFTTVDDPGHGSDLNRSWFDDRVVRGRAYSEITNNPMEAAEALGLITLRGPYEDRASSNGFSIDRYYSIQINDGPDKGVVLGGPGEYRGLFWLDQTFRDYRGRARMIRNHDVFNKNTERFGPGTIGFMNYCEKLLSYYYATRTLSSHSRHGFERRGLMFYPP